MVKDMLELCTEKKFNFLAINDIDDEAFEFKANPLQRK
jgi:hypothetical protein